MAEGFVKEGRNVFFLSMSEPGSMQMSLQKVGVNTIEYVIEKKTSLSYYWKHSTFLRKFIKRNDISIVYSHLLANVPALITQFFTKTPIVLNRHHADAAIAQGQDRNAKFDRIVNTWAKKIIVVSQKAFDHIVEVEKGNREKIEVMPLAYNFDLVKSNKTIAQSIKLKYSADLLLISIGRLIGIKRHSLMIDVVHEQKKEGHDIKLIILGDGLEKESLERKIKDLNLEDQVYLLGHQPNVFDYIEASDLLLHLSVSESSCNVTREAAILKKPVIVCKGVGDFEEYIVHEENGFLLNKYQPVDECINVVMDIYKKRFNILQMGEKLNRAVIEKFDVKNILPLYQRLYNSLDESFV